jgi:hypothetical protein
MSKWFKIVSFVFVLLFVLFAAGSIKAYRVAATKNAPETEGLKTGFSQDDIFEAAGPGGIFLNQLFSSIE